MQNRASVSAGKRQEKCCNLEPHREAEAGQHGMAMTGCVLRQLKGHPGHVQGFFGISSLAGFEAGASRGHSKLIFGMLRTLLSFPLSWGPERFDMYAYYMYIFAICTVHILHLSIYT